MTTNSWIPKIVAFIGGGAQLVAQFYPQTQSVCGLISALAFLGLGLVVRQDNLSSEQVGAGNTGKP